MIHAAGQPGPALPWELRAAVERVAFAMVWTTGPDPTGDFAFRLMAERPGELGQESFDRYLRAEPGSVGDSQEGASARMTREFGVRSADLAEGASAEEAGPELLGFLEGFTVVVPDRRAFEAWMARLSGTGEFPVHVVGLPELAALLLPGRLASEGERLTAALLERDDLDRRPRAITPVDLRDALAELVGETQSLEAGVLGLLAHAQLEAFEALRDAEEPGADELSFALTLCEHPSAWSGGHVLFAAGQSLSDGCLSAAYRIFNDVIHAVEEARPTWGRAAKADRLLEPTPIVADEPRTLDEADRKLVDEILQEHLPRTFATDDGNEPSYREGQHAIASEIARGFGQRELLLLHAPTGTGKTLAYLIPVALWAFRNSVRVGVSTYTRALQEQALDREVPLARALLRKAGVTGELRVALLKGRQNYLCWRAVKLHAPERRDGIYEKVAWSMLAGFAVTDPEGDLDRLPRRAPLTLSDPARYRRALQRLVTQVRSQAGCCIRSVDREDCAGLASRRRAERAHVVITNHAFALARREFFRHLVFDECEHLHAQAHSAFSYTIPFRALRDLLTGLHKPGGPSRAPLNRVQAVALPESEAAYCLERSVDAQEVALLALDDLQRAAYRFKLWREDTSGARHERDLHSLFREYILEENPRDLLDSHGSLYGALSDLGVSLAELVEHLDTLPTRGVMRIRRNLDILRSDLDDLMGGVEAWVPRGEEREPIFRPETFYDLETTPRRDDVMCARVLLPHEHLGRHYYPDLAGAVLISATTWLRGGFEASSIYLGCHRAANPADNEEREPMPLRTFRAPDAFDYGRVLVAAPRDAPPPSAGKRAQLEYIARFVAYLTERSRGRVLVLFTNADDCSKAAALVEPFLAERRIPFWHQRMEGSVKEELAELFRSHVDSVLFGLDTFWYGADFPGETLEYLIIARLPYGVPDRYHHAQSAVLGVPEQRKRIYMPRALAKFRQGFGRLMRKESDRGCVFLLDPRVNDPRHRGFLRELPIRLPDSGEVGAGAHFVRGEADRCLHEAFAHMGMLADIRRRNLDQSFTGWRRDGGASESVVEEKPHITEGELPY